MRICVYFIFYGMFSSLDRGFYVLLTISFQSYIVLSVSFYLFFFSYTVKPVLNSHSGLSAGLLM